MEFFLIFFYALGISFVLTPLSIKIAHKTDAIDIPKDNRRVHKTPVPKIGGMAIFFGTILAMILALVMNMIGSPETEMKIVGIVIGAILIYCLGIVDDFKDLSALTKMFGQICCAIVVFAFGNRIVIITNFWGESTQHLDLVGSLIITIVWIVAITNTINLVDGMDGLATGISVIASFCIAYVAYISGYYSTSLCLLAVAGGALGFLPYNLFPAKSFMGDGGSLFLGFMLANLSVMEPVKQATVVAVLIPVLVLALPIFDTIWAIIRRKANGKPIMQADKGHIHHRLMRAGMGQRRIVLCLYGICGIMGVAAIVFSRGLYVEFFILLLVAVAFTMVVMTDKNNLRPRLKIAIDQSKLEQDVIRDIHSNLKKFG